MSNQSQSKNTFVDPLEENICCTCKWELPWIPHSSWLPLLTLTCPPWTCRCWDVLVKSSCLAPRKAGHDWRTVGSQGRHQHAGLSVPFEKEECVNDVTCFHFQTLQTAFLPSVILRTCDLFEVTAKQGLTGNCFLSMSTGSVLSLGWNLILGIMMSFPERNSTLRQ